MKELSILAKLATARIRATCKFYRFLLPDCHGRSLVRRAMRLSVALATTTSKKSCAETLLRILEELP